MSEWRFHNPVRIHFQPGFVRTLEENVQQIPGKRIALVTSPGFTRRGVVDQLKTALGNRLVAVRDDVQPNPDVEAIDAQAETLRDHTPDTLLALGGGSSIDTAKALARLLSQPKHTRLAGHFRDKKDLQPERALPICAIPTTAGTGAEVTPFGTVWDFTFGNKYSVTGDDLYPQTAILDPELTHELPEEVTITSGLDAISHAFESIWNRNANPVTIALATRSLQYSLKALPQLKNKPDNEQARADMMQASLLAGMAISHTRTALAHSISYPLTTTFGLPHGIACSFTLPGLLHFNSAVDDGRLRESADALGFNDTDELAQHLLSLFAALGAADIFDAYVAEHEVVMGMVDQMIAPDRAGNNIRSSEFDDVRHILERSLRRSHMNGVA